MFARWACPDVVLTGDVPQLEADDGARVPVQHFEREVHSDGGSVMMRENLVHVAPDDGRLPYTQVPYN